MIVIIEYDITVVVKIYFWVMCNYFIVLFLLTANKCYILLFATFCSCSKEIAAPRK